MNQQIARLSPHQNGKVMAVLMALFALVFFAPFMLLASAFAPGDSRFPFWMLIVMPVIYLVFTYISVAIACLVYNAMVPFLGGIEYEPRSSERPA